MATQVSLDGKEWVRDEAPESSVDFVKLDVGETLVGLLLEKKPNPTFQDKMIYVIKQKDGTQKIINGTTSLDLWMKNREVGEELLIKRLPDKPSIDPAKQPLQQYETYSLKNDGGDKS